MEVFYNFYLSVKIYPLNSKIQIQIQIFPRKLAYVIPELAFGFGGLK